MNKLLKGAHNRNPAVKPQKPLPRALNHYGSVVWVFPCAFPRNRRWRWNNSISRIFHTFMPTRVDWFRIWCTARSILPRWDELISLLEMREQFVSLIDALQLQWDVFISDWAMCDGGESWYIPGCVGLFLRWTYCRGNWTTRSTFSPVFSKSRNDVLRVIDTKSRLDGR